MRPDELCKTVNAKEIKIKMTYSEGCVFIEGDAKTLEFLGNLFMAQAQYENDCGFQMTFNGAGNAFFDKTSNVGLYIHRLPCNNHKSACKLDADFPKSHDG